MSEPYIPTDRRPIAARQTRWAAALAEMLARRGVSANAVSLAGMAAGLAAGGFLAATAHGDPLTTRLAFLAGAVCVQLRLLANLLDGMVAVASGTASRVGELYNEVPDRISDAVTLVGLGYASGGDPALGYVAALAAVLTAYVRAVGKAAGAKNEFCGPFAKQQRMAVVTLAALVCAGVSDLEWNGLGLPAWALIVIVVGSLLTTVRRLARITATLRNPTP